jgi:hypothetical protein
MADFAKIARNAPTRIVGLVKGTKPEYFIRKRDSNGVAYRCMKLSLLILRYLQ